MKRDIDDVIVIGAGYAGVHCAHELERQAPGLRLRVLEASGRVGGRARSIDPGNGGPIIDLGAHYFGVEHRRVRRLARRYLDADEVFSHVGNFGDNAAFRTLLDGRWRISTRDNTYFNVPGLTRETLASEALQIFESLCAQLALEALVDVRAPWNTPFARYIDQLSFAEWIEAQSLAPWVEQMWDLGASGLLSSSPERFSLLYWAWYVASNGGFLAAVNDHVGGPQEFSVRCGLGGLLEHHAASLRAPIELGTPVVAIDHATPGRVEVHTASGQTLAGRKVVVAASPAAVLDNIHFDPGLGPTRYELLSQARGHAVKVVAAYDEPWWRDSLGGYHFLGYGGGSGTEGAEWALDVSEPDREPHLLMVFFHPALFDSHPEGPERDAAILAEIERISGDPRARDCAALWVMNWRDHAWVGGGPNTIMAPGLLSRLGGVLHEPEGSHRQLHFTGAEYASEWCGYVEGALAAAELTAAQLLADLEGGVDARDRVGPGGRGSQPLRALAYAAGFAGLAPLRRIVAATEALSRRAPACWRRAGRGRRTSSRG